MKRKEIKSAKIHKIPDEDLMDLYNDPSFVPSMNLQKMFDAGVFGTSSQQ